jgi:hypothetical protein
VRSRSSNASGQLPPQNPPALPSPAVYRRGTDGAREFVEMPEPTDEAQQMVLHKISPD